jgi:hypothetical protein
MIPFRLIAGLALSLAAVTGAQAADTYPARPIRLIATFGPGSSIDIIARLVAQAPGRAAGPAGDRREQARRRRRPGHRHRRQVGKDGYTIGFASAGPITVNPNARKKMPYDPAQGSGAGCAGGDGTERHPGQSVHPGDEPEGADRLHQGQSEQGQLRLGRRGHQRPISPASCSSICPRPRSCTCPTRATAMRSPTPWAGRTQMVISGVPPILSFVKSGQLRALAVAGHQAFAPAAGRPHCRRSRPAWRGKRRLVRHCRACRHAAGDPGSSSRRDHQGREQPGNPGEIRRPGHCSLGGQPGGLRQAHGGRVRAFQGIVQADQPGHGLKASCRAPLSSQAPAGW